MWATHFTKTKHSRKLRLDIKLKRVPIEVVVTGFESTLIKGHLLLNDMTGKGIAIYTATRLTEGQEITIKAKEPKAFEVKGVVVFCVENLSDSHIVSENVYTQRTGVLFKFASAEEGAKYAALLADFQANYMGITGSSAGDSAAISKDAPTAPLSAVPDTTAPAVAPAAEGDGGALPQAA